MTIGPRETAHRQHRDALQARDAALKVHGMDSEIYKAAEARLADAVRALPEPPQQWE